MRGREAPTRFWVELFIVANLCFLALDVYIAHSSNGFAHWAEWIPVTFSIAGPTMLVAVWIGSKIVRSPAGSGWTPTAHAFGRQIGLAVGWGSVLVGVSGMLFHLNSQFFAEQTLKNLVYAAPFAAPLAYSGLGLLLLLDRMVESESVEWARWVLVLSLGGFAGNFVLSLADHAQNGFFDPREWIPVIASAFAVGFLLVAASLCYNNRTFLRLCLWLMALQAAVGTLGAYYHSGATLAGPMDTLWENVLYGPPVFAPLLFPNLAALAAIGLWALSEGCNPDNAGRRQATRSL